MNSQANQTLYTYTGSITKTASGDTNQKIADSLAGQATDQIQNTLLSSGLISQEGMVNIVPKIKVELANIISSEINKRKNGSRAKDVKSCVSIYVAQSTPDTSGQTDLRIGISSATWTDHFSKPSPFSVNFKQSETRGLYLVILKDDTNVQPGGNEGSTWSHIVADQPVEIGESTLAWEIVSMTRNALSWKENIKDFPTAGSVNQSRDQILAWLSRISDSNRSSTTLGDH